MSAQTDHPAQHSAQVTPAQYDYLRKAISPDRVRQAQGQSHVEAWDVRRTLIRIFGFGGYAIESRYETMIREIEIPADKPNGKSRWTVVYRVGLRLIIKAPDGTPITFFDDAATGDSCNQPSLGDAHDQALKTAHSQALKRCATNLGDQFGLSLYNKGNVGGVVVGSLVSPQSNGPAPTPEDAPAVLGGEMDDDQTRPDEAPQAPVSVPQQARGPVRERPAPPVPPVALKTAAQAAGCDDAATLRGVRKWAGEQKILDHNVRPAIEAAAVALKLPDGPVTLVGWLDVCIARVEAEGLSIDDQVRVIAEEGVPA